MKASLTQISLLLLSTFAPLLAESPSGWIHSSSNFVRADTTVELNWKINLPTPIRELVNFENPENEIQVRSALLAEVKVLGAAMGAMTNPMYGESLVHGGNSGWNTIFSGWANGLGATSTNTFYLTEGQKLDFIFKTWNRSSPFRSQADWGSLRTPVTTGTGDERLFILKNGDEAPSFEGAFDQAASEAFIEPYLMEDGKTIRIPETSLILFAELNERIDRTADFQDFVVLVNFTDVNPGSSGNNRNNGNNGNQYGHDNNNGNRYGHGN